MERTRGGGLVLAVAVMTLGLWAPACGGPKKKTTQCTPINVAIQADKQVNLDDAGQPLATVVRIYQLKSLDALQNADFEDVWLKPDKTLAKDLVTESEVTVFPGQRLSRTMKIKPEANFLVGVALFRKPVGGAWHAEYKLPICGPVKQGPPQVGFQLDGYRVEKLHGGS